MAGKWCTQKKRGHDPLWILWPFQRVGTFESFLSVVYSSNGTNHSIFGNSSSQETSHVAGSKSTWVRLVGSLSTITRSPTLSLKAGTCQRFWWQKESRCIAVLEGSTMLILSSITMHRRKNSTSNLAKHTVPGSRCWQHLSLLRGSKSEKGNQLLRVLSLNTVETWLLWTPFGHLSPCTLGHVDHSVICRDFQPGVLWPAS